MDMRSEMGSQGTFSRATFTRCENNDVHTLASRLTPEAKMNQRADSRKKNLGVIVAKPLINRRRWLLSHTVRCKREENGVEKAFDRVIERFSACWHQLQRILPVRAFAFQGTGRSCANKPSPDSCETVGW